MHFHVLKKLSFVSFGPKAKNIENLKCGLPIEVVKLGLRKTGLTKRTWSHRQLWRSTLVETIKKC